MGPSFWGPLARPILEEAWKILKFRIRQAGVWTGPKNAKPNPTHKGSGKLRRPPEAPGGPRRPLEAPEPPQAPGPEGRQEKAPKRSRKASSETRPRITARQRRGGVGI